MNHDRLTAEDPRLTSYVLGELDAADSAIVETALRTDPALRAEVDSIRRCATALESALAAEAVPVVPEAEPEATPRRARPRRRWIVFPQFYFVVGGLAAAGFAVVVAINRDDIEAKERLRAEHLRAAFVRRNTGATELIALPLAMETPSAAARGESLMLVPDFGEAAYANVRRFLAGGRLPPVEDVRPAELINALRYRLPVVPATTTEPVAAVLEKGVMPWAPARTLVRIGVRGRDVALPEVSSGGDDSAVRSQVTIARDVQIRVEFNPAWVAGYRLIGRDGESSTRDMPKDDLAAAEEWHARQTFTALYEITPVAPTGGDGVSTVRDAQTGDLLTVRVQFIAPSGGGRRTLEFSLAGRSDRAKVPSADFQLASAAADFALVLRHAPSRAGFAALQDVLSLAATTSGNAADDADGRSAEFFSLVRQAQLLME